MTILNSTAFKLSPTQAHIEDNHLIIHDNKPCSYVIKKKVSSFVFKKSNFIQLETENGTCYLNVKQLSSSARENLKKTIKDATASENIINIFKNDSLSLENKKIKKIFKNKSYKHGLIVKSNGKKFAISKQPDHSTVPVEIIKKIGSGSFCKVYQAHTVDKTPYALKLTKKDLEKNELVDFRNSYKLLKNIHKDGLIPGLEKPPRQFWVIDRKETSGNKRYGYLGALYRGNLSATSGFSENVCDIHPVHLIKCFYTLVEGVSYLAKNNIVHGDVEPSNILWYLNDSKQVVFHLGDFGCAQTFDEIKKKFTEKDFKFIELGKTTYWTSEDTRSKVDARDQNNVSKYIQAMQQQEVFALGFSFYEIISGQPPYKVIGGRIEGDTSKIDISPLQQIELEPKMIELILRMLEINPAQRPSLETIKAEMSHLLTSLGISEQDKLVI